MPSPASPIHFLPPGTNLAALPHIVLARRHLALAVGGCSTAILLFLVRLLLVLVLVKVLVFRVLFLARVVLLRLVLLRLFLQKRTRTRRSSTAVRSIPTGLVVNGERGDITHRGLLQLALGEADSVAVLLVLAFFVLILLWVGEKP